MPQKYLPRWPSYSDEEIQSVNNVLASGKVNYWTGSITKDFEKAFSEWCGAKYAIAVSNGTVALQLCLMGLGIGSNFGGSANDEIIVTPRSFIASASVVVMSGAMPVFADVCPESQNIDPAYINGVLSEHTKAIICVHHAGWPCDIDAIKKVIGNRDIKIIEDCAQAHGALYKGQSVGALGDVAAWSFCQDKIMSTGGEGGMVTCNERNLWERMWSYKDHGKNYNLVNSESQELGFRWLHTRFGSNFRLTEMQSAIGRIQLQKLSNWVEDRNRNAGIFLNALKPFADESGPIRIPQPICKGCIGQCQPEGCRHAYYRLYVFTRPENLKETWTRDRLVSEFSAQSIPCMQGTCPEIYREEAFVLAGFSPDAPLPIAQELGKQSIAFLVHPTLTEEHMVELSTLCVSILKQAWTGTSHY